MTIRYRGTRRGRGSTLAGTCSSAATAGSSWPNCLEGCFIDVIDPVWGRDDVLGPLLLRAIFGGAASALADQTAP